MKPMKYRKEFGFDLNHLIFFPTFFMYFIFLMFSC
jgi:hypothetical protein